MNYGNRNASSAYSVRNIFKSYFYALAASISIGLFTRHLVASWTVNMAGGTLFLINSITAYIATASAGFTNAFMMRLSELKGGISIYDPADMNEPIGISRTAARRAVLQTAVSRMLLCLPMLGPGFALYGIEKFGLMPASFFASTVLQMFLFVVELYYELPLCLAMFSPIGRIKA